MNDFSPAVSWCVLREARYKLARRVRGKLVGNYPALALAGYFIMFLKNYTSDVPVSQTIYRIEQVLIKCGVSGITKEYGPHSEIVAIRFHLRLADSKEITVRLPADKERALDALWLDYADGDKLTPDGNRLAWNYNRKKKQRADFAAQAERTAWKIVQDWVEVQMSMIQLKQADTIEVFMSYIWDGRETFYNRIKSGGYRALLPETSEVA